MSTFWSFLGHDGIRVLFFLFVIIGNFAKARVRAAKQNEAKLRGGTAIRDFSAPDAPPSPLSNGSGGSSNSGAARPVAAPPQTPVSRPKPPGSAPGSAPNSPSGSPWSSNQNPFDSKKP